MTGFLSTVRPRWTQGSPDRLGPRCADAGGRFRRWASWRGAFQAQIVGMRYTGMAAMQMVPAIRYTMSWFALSIGIAVIASGSALWITFQLRLHSHRVRLLRTGAAAIMGCAIVGMHLGKNGYCFDDVSLKANARAVATCAGLASGSGASGTASALSAKIRGIGQENGGCRSIVTLGASNTWFDSA